MRSIIIGLGVQGQKRLMVSGAGVAATVDPVKPGADYASVKEVPLDLYEAAFVCVPDQAKVEIVTYLLSHNKHVLVEKPLLAESDEEIAHLDALARERGVVCYTAYNHRFEPHHRRMKELLESGDLGTLYFARLFYGNGTARDVRSSAWRDEGLGVLSDLGSHLLDTVSFWFGTRLEEFRVAAAHRFENRALDHVIITTEGPPAVELEATLLSWRNHFAADIYGERGSAHIESLCKWGPTTFTLRKRVLPSGRPPAESVVLVQPDPTWQLEYEHFTQLCQLGRSSLDSDVWLNRTLRGLGQQAGTERSS